MYAGKAPVTRRSRDERIRRRLPGSRATATCETPCSSGHSALSNDPGGLESAYDRHVADHHSHHAALRAFGNRWPEVRWHCLTPWGALRRGRAHRQPQPRLARRRRPGHCTAFLDSCRPCRSEKGSMWSAHRLPARASGPEPRTNDIDPDERRQTIPQRGRPPTNRPPWSTDGVSRPRIEVVWLTGVAMSAASARLNRSNPG